METQPLPWTACSNAWQPFWWRNFPNIQHKNTRGRKERPPSDIGHLHVVSACLLQLSQDHCWFALSSLLCSSIRKKIGDSHQQWMLPHLLGRLLDHYSLSGIKRFWVVFFCYRISLTGACFYSDSNSASSQHKILYAVWCKFENTQFCTLSGHYASTLV